MCLIGAVMLAGCATAPTSWTRPDGQTPATAQLQLDETACRGEVDKANMDAGENRVILGESRAMRSVFDGCMASKGYLPE